MTGSWVLSGSVGFAEIFAKAPDMAHMRIQFLGMDLPALETVRMFPGLHDFFFNKWYFDELYDAIIVKPALSLGRVFWKKGDGAAIDGLGPDNIAARAQDVAGVLSRFQSGYLYHYAFVMLVGVAGFVTYFMLATR